jgi:hypothetical protein
MKNNSSVKDLNEFNLMWWFYLGLKPVFASNPTTKSGQK